MKISIIYSSITGNTKLIASAIKDALSGKNIVYFGPVGNDLPEADIYIIGSWTDKGNGSKQIIDFIKNIKNKKIAYFGTAGYKKDKEYYATLFSRIKDNIDSSNEILGYFYCQGKMPIAVRERYVNLLKENPDDANLEVSVKNFDEALNHPDDKDILDAKKWVKDIIKGL